MTIQNQNEINYKGIYAVHIRSTRVDDPDWCTHCDRENVSLRVLEQPGSDHLWTFCDHCYAEWEEKWKAKGGQVSRELDDALDRDTLRGDQDYQDSRR